MNCQFWKYTTRKRHFFSFRLKKEKKKKGISSQLWWWDGNRSRSTQRHTPEKFSYRRVGVALFVPLENSTFAVLVICTVDKSSSVFMMLKVSRKWRSWPLQVKINKNRKLQPNLSRLLQTCHCWLLTRRKLWVKSIWRHIQQQFSYPRASQLSYWRSFASDLTDFPYPRSHPQSTWRWS